jgi:hypothetical protein
MGAVNGLVLCGAALRLTAGGERWAKLQSAVMQRLTRQLAV